MIHALIAQIFIAHTEYVTPTGMKSSKENTESETQPQPVIVEAKISKCST